VLVQVKNKRERSSPVRPPGVEKTSRLRSSDLVAGGVKCGPHGGMNRKMKSWTEEPKTTWEPSHEWRLAEATPSSRGSWWFTRKPLVPWLIHKAKTEEPKTEMQQLQTGTHRSDRWVPV
jgi:hypothetical protein